MPYMIGALKWITWINPLRYGFEAMMANEFHAIHAECSTLVCTTVGSEPGSSTVSGARYVELAYSYTYDHVWRNFGVLIAFGVGFISFLLILTELNQSLAGESSVMLFKRGS
ncbi:CDR ABC transporter-domain-containing protein, partial [Epithele typhae]|uniref:CDR ABC transporter-domain-containing protein n=1 Tax=Epithele typhae TaxID=378194 RepID=UPI002007C0B3